MPSKNTVKIYAPNCYYHVYNRGVEKRIIFEDDQDYRVFLSYLKEALSPPADPNSKKIDVTFKGSTFKGVPRQVKNFHKRMDLVAFALMPNHFHLLMYQTNARDLKEFVQSLATRYSMYFNKRYERIGSLFQSRYKAALIDSEEYLLYLTRYIHRNPMELGKRLHESYSSYAAYLGKQQLNWIKPDTVLSYFSRATLPYVKKVNTYRSFVEDFDHDDIAKLENLTLEYP